MDKNEVMRRINAVMKTLDTGIEVRGVQNAGNLAGCFAILEGVAKYLSNCEITPMPQEEEGIELQGD